MLLLLMFTLPDYATWAGGNHRTWANSWPRPCTKAEQLPYVRLTTRGFWLGPGPLRGAGLLRRLDSARIAAAPRGKKSITLYMWEFSVRASTGLTTLRMEMSSIVPRHGMRQHWGAKRKPHHRGNV